MGSLGGRGELRDGKQKSLNVTPSLLSESESGDISSCMQDPSPDIESPDIGSLSQRRE